MFNWEQEKAIQRVIVVVEKGLVDSVFDVRFRNCDEGPRKKDRKAGYSERFIFQRRRKDVKDPSAKALNGDRKEE
jgi:hypothetical protein